MDNFLGRHWKIIFLILLITSGLILQKTDLIDWRELLQTIRTYSDNDWLIVVLILYQIILYMFALPGSTTLWLVAPIYAPTIATLILTTGGTLGAVAAYVFSHRLGEDWQRRIKAQPLFHSLQQRGDLLTLFGLRILPGFPHSVINYASGLLRLPVRQFILATAIGLTIKNIIYCTVIYRSFELGTSEQDLTIEDVVPLLILAGLIMALRLGQYFFSNRSNH